MFHLIYGKETVEYFLKEFPGIILKQQREVKKNHNNKTSGGLECGWLHVTLTQIIYFPVGGKLQSSQSLFQLRFALHNTMNWIKSATELITQLDDDASVLPITVNALFAKPSNELLALLFTWDVILNASLIALIQTKVDRHCV